MSNKVLCILLGLSLFSCSLSAYGNSNDSIGWKWGVKAGLGSTYLTHHHLYMLGARKATFTMGMMGEYRFKSWFALRSSLEYNHKGGGMLSPRLFYAKDEPMAAIPQINKTLYACNLTLHSIEMPVVPCFYIPVQSVFTPFILTGLSGGVNFHARLDNYYLWEFPDAPNDLLDELSDFVLDKLAKFDGGIYVGVGTEIALKKRTMEIGYTFRMGMSYEDRFLYTLFHKYSSVSSLAYVGVKF